MDVIPIKNAKYARECIEIHLAHRNVELLINFDQFPNLECLWLNDNKIEKIEGRQNELGETEGLDTNFRIRELYLHNNKLKSLEGSFSNLAHLSILSLFNNELRGLDKCLNVLGYLTRLQNLDLFGNPVAEEPNYRMRVIHAIPSLAIFDRHVIILMERQKAKKLADFEKQEVVVQKKKQPKKVLKATEQFSQTEWELHEEAHKIEKKYEEKKEREELKKKNVLKERFKKWNRDYITENDFFTDLNKRLKDPEYKKTQTESLSKADKASLAPVFTVYEKDKKIGIKKEDLQKFFNDLVEDKGSIGMSPSCTFEEFAEAILPAGDSIKWPDFSLRIGKTPWLVNDIESTKKRIASYYNEANKLIYSGKGNQAGDFLNRAIRLQKKVDEVNGLSFVPPLKVA